MKPQSQHKLTVLTALNTVANRLTSSLSAQVYKILERFESESAAKNADHRLAILCFIANNSIIYAEEGHFYPLRKVFYARRKSNAGIDPFKGDRVPIQRNLRAEIIIECTKGERSSEHRKIAVPEKLKSAGTAVIVKPQK